MKITFYDHEPILTHPRKGVVSNEHKRELETVAKMGLGVDRREAFLRVETAADLFDAMLLLLMGVDVGFEPVTGALSGFARPTKPLVIRRVTSQAAPAPHVKRRIPTVRVAGEDAFSLAYAIREMVTNKESMLDYVLDISALGPGDRTTEIGNVLLAIANLLNERCLRPLSRTDICDLLGWVASLSDARLDAQVPYGSEEWGDLMRNDTSVQFGARAAPPANPRYSRTVVCWSRPNIEHLEKLFAHATKTGQSFGIVNATLAKSRFGWFKGCGPSLSVLLPNYGLCPVVTIDVSGIAEGEPLFRAMRLAGRAAYREGHSALRLDYEALQQPWRDQMQAIAISAVQPVNYQGIEDRQSMRNHALYGAMKMADELRMIRPTDITCSVVDNLDASIAMLPNVDYNAAFGQGFDPMNAPHEIDKILANWDVFVGGRWTPST